MKICIEIALLPWTISIYSYWLFYTTLTNLINITHHVLLGILFLTAWSTPPSFLFPALI